MSLNKRKKADNVEFADNRGDMAPRSHSTGIDYLGKITNHAKSENLLQNIRKDRTSQINSQVAQPSRSAKKRKSFDDKEPEISERSSRTKSTAVTKFHVDHTEKKVLKAARRLETTKSCVSSLVNTKCTRSETAVQKIKNSYDSGPEKSSLRDATVKRIDRRDLEKRFLVTTERSDVKISGVSQKTKRNLAQSRLLAKRKEFEIAAKKALSSGGLDNSSNLLIGRQGVSKVLQSKRSSSSASYTSSVMGRVKEKVKRHMSEIKGTLDDANNSISQNDDSSVCIDEEMDWEPIEEEVMIEHIKTMRRNRDNIELSTNIAVSSNVDMETSYDNNLILVFDTNVFISCLPFIKDIRDTSVPGFGLPRIFIPWRVLQELDHLKKSDIKPLQVSAIRAIRFLNESFSSRHPRMSGQSLDDFTSTAKSSSSNPDDEILQVCLNLKQKDLSRTVVLITNDKNLESKAIISSVEAYSKDRFVKDKLPNEKACNVDTNSKGKNTTKVALANDMFYCRLKGSLKKFLLQFLEIEFEKAFGDKWQKIVRYKTTWTLMDMIDCFIKYWRSVFTLIFKKNFLDFVEEFKTQIKRVESGNCSTLEDIAEASKQFLTEIKCFTKVDEPYSKIVDDTLNEVEAWIKVTRDVKLEKAKESENAHPDTSVPSSSKMAETGSIFDASLCREKVKNLFQIIWDQVNAFFCRISELASSNGGNNPEAVMQVRNQFPHVIQKVRELVEIAEKILSFGPQDSSQANEIILHFTNFLISLNVFQIDAVEMNNLPGYIAMFCSDHDGRVVLYTFVNGMKQIAAGMLDGMKVLEGL